MLRWGLPLVLFLGVAPSFAQPVLHKIVEVVGSLDESTVIQWAGSRVQKSISWGTRVRYLGAITLGAAAIYAALDYFYRSVSSQAEPSLDAWYYWQDIPFGSWDMVITSWYCDSAINRMYWRYTYPNANRTYEVAVGSCSSPSVADAQAYLDSRYPPSPGFSWVSGQGRRYEVVPGQWSNAPPYIRANLERPPLPDWLASHPEAARALRDRVLPPWIEERFSDPVSFSNPAPGIKFDPAPNINQWYDDPYRSPYVDTDGDGWPDWVEDRLGADPSSPSSYPPPDGDADGDGFTNWEEALVGTDPMDPASRPDPGANRDTDGDSIPDSADPCPSDPFNSCGDLAVPLPDTPNFPEVETPELPDIWTELLERQKQRLQSLKDTLMDQFPFGLVKWVPKPVYQETSCPAVYLGLPNIPVEASIPYCDNPFWEAAHNYLRPLLAVLSYVAFAFLVVRRGLGVS